MAKKKLNNILAEDSNCLSQYDPGQVAKDIHSLPGHYIRTKESLTVVSDFFDHFTVDYDGEFPSQVCYFAGTKAHLTTIGFRADNAGDLAGTYFLISAGRKEKRFAVYYTVNGSGAAPALTDVENIQVDVSTNDPAAIVAYATELALNSYDHYFGLKRTNSVLEITTCKRGITDDTVDAGTSFLITNDAGESYEVDKVNLTYSNGNPVWQGQELKNYKYNIYTARFEVNEQIGVEVELETTASNFSILNVSIPLANTPVTVVIPDNTRRIKMQAENNAVTKVIDNISGDYFTIKMGASFDVDNINSSGMSFDIEMSKGNNSLQLMLWS